MNETIVKPSTINKDVLSILGRKLKNGNELTMAEDLMAISASAAMTANFYGPGPAEMQVHRPELPESVKGLLIEYAG